MKRLNDWLALQVTKGMATMWCAYAFLIWSLLPLMWPAIQSMVFYVSGGIIQLVALSLIMVGQQVMGRAAEQRAQQDHETIMAEFAVLKDLHADQRRELAEIKALHREIKTFARLSDQDRQRMLEYLESRVNPKVR